MHVTTGIEQAVPNPRSHLRVWPLLKAARPHQLLKNLLIFLPLLLAHEWNKLALWNQSFRAFLAFCFCASGVYVLNDLIDLKADRAHPIKRNRPFASHQLSSVPGLVYCAMLLLTSAVVAGGLPGLFALHLGAYAVTAIIYLVAVKRVAILDVTVLAGLYTIRVLAGGAATGIHISGWLLAFSSFLFLSLAFSKRYAEIGVCGGTASSRPYNREDLDLIAAAGVASANAGAVVFVLYVQSPETAVLYQRPGLLWLTCPVLLYWLNRLWLLTRRGKMNEDAILFALTDRASYAAAAVTTAILALAL